MRNPSLILRHEKNRQRHLERKNNDGVAKLYGPPHTCMMKKSFFMEIKHIQESETSCFVFSTRFHYVGVF
jgi:hypothetical protein